MMSTFYVGKCGTSDGIENISTITMPSSSGDCTLYFNTNTSNDFAIIDLKLYINNVNSIDIQTVNFKIVRFKTSYDANHTFNDGREHYTVCRCIQPYSDDWDAYSHASKNIWLRGIITDSTTLTGLNSNYINTSWKYALEINIEGNSCNKVIIMNNLQLKNGTLFTSCESMTLAAYNLLLGGPWTDWFTNNFQPDNNLVE